MIPTTPQRVPQPYTTESTTNETTVNYSNQEQTTTWFQPSKSQRRNWLQRQLGKK